MSKEDRNVMEQAQTKERPISELRLDPGNVRLEHTGAHDMTERQIEEYFWKEKATKELYAQIRTARGVFQNLIVTQVGLVKEGNRRLVCLRRLSEEAHAGKLVDIPENQFDVVRCDVLPADATDREVSMLLSTIHVHGKKAWDPFDKAKMLFHLHHDLNATYDDLAKELGKGKVTIMRAINAYEATKSYGEKYRDDSNWYNKFTYFDELFQRRALKSWRDNLANLEQFGSWIHDNKLNDSRHVRSLEKILDNASASKIFDREGFDRAMIFLNSVDPTMYDSDFRKIQNTIVILRSLDRKAMLRIINDPNRKNMLRELRKEVTSLLADTTALESATKKGEEEGESQA